MNKKALIIGIIVVVIVLGGICGIIFLRNGMSDVEKEVIEIVNNLNNDNGDYGDWNNNLHIIKLKEVKKIDYNLLGAEEQEEINKNDSMFMINLEEEMYGDVKIIVINGKVTANSILGETYEEMWNSNIFTNDKINIDKINKSINEIK